MNIFPATVAIPAYAMVSEYSRTIASTAIPVTLFNALAKYTHTLAVDCASANSVIAYTIDNYAVCDFFYLHRSQAS